MQIYISWNIMYTKLAISHYYPFKVWLQFKILIKWDLKSLFSFSEREVEKESRPRGWNLVCFYLNILEGGG